jgi:hypothetical protein
VVLTYRTVDDARQQHEGTEGWVPFCEVLYRWRRNEQGRLGYHLCAIKPISWLDPEDCDLGRLDVGFRFRPRPWRRWRCGVVQLRVGMSRQ